MLPPAGAVERARAADSTEPVVGRLECGGVAEALLGLADKEDLRLWQSCPVWSVLSP